MPQDTIWLNSDHTSYTVLPPGTDSIPEGVKQYLQLHPNDGRQHKKKSESSEWPSILAVIGIFVISWIIIRIRDGKNNGYVALGSMVQNESDYDIIENDGNPVITEPGYLVYEGGELHFTDEELNKILHKRSNYFIDLDKTGKEKFLYRLRKFIKQKTFFIHDKSGFKEMPVLISAAAIQLSFGLQKYLLPDFPHIHIFPQEFIATEPTIRFLEGNVSNNCINISWKHFLEGFNHPDDGQNVGLHEMAHAYYFQNVEIPDNKDHSFVHTFTRFDDHGNKCFMHEQEPGNDLYSDYALKNFQEFWAESVEIFFERPAILRSVYPDLYAAMSDLLNQDPLNKAVGI